MTVRVLMACAALGTLAVPVVADAGSPRDRATGGGQVLFDEDGVGPGNTIAFTVQEDRRGGVKGEVQYNDRENDRKYHGEPTCLEVDGNIARIAGTWERASDGSTSPFNIYVEDNGNGAGKDIVMVTPVNGEPQCGDIEPGDDPPALARGNTQVHDAAEGGGQQSRRAPASKLSYDKALRLAGLR